MYDIIVIGSGPGGYVTAIRAAQLGFKTAVVEKSHLGGICLNWGCIPTKALLRTAQVKHLASNLKEYGLVPNGDVQPDINAIVTRSRNVSKKLNAGVGYLLKKNNVDIIWGKAKLQKDGTAISVVVSDAGNVQNPLVAEPPKSVKGAGSYKAKHIIIATGARPRVLPGIEIDEKLILSYFGALAPTEIPENLVIVGSGAIGIEFASFYNEMGSKVTVVEKMAHILPSEDEEIVKLAAKKLKSKGINFITNASIAKLTKSDNKLSIEVKQDDGRIIALEADKMISAAGVIGNIEGLGLEEIGVQVKNNIIVTDEWSRTNVASVYAIGDVAGAPMLAHKAEEEGVICVEKIANFAGVHPLDKGKIPGCIYCEPQVASVGLTERKAIEQGYEICVGRYNFSANGKAIALGEDYGMVKTIFDKKTGQLLGAHMVGAEVTEMIQGFVVAMNLETTEHELMSTIFPHPTLSEMMKESVLDAFGRVLNA